MKNVYEVSINGKFADYCSTHEARAAVEEAGHGMIVKFVVEPNLPNCLPKEVHRSCAAWTLDDGTWYRLAIHGPDNGIRFEETPE